MYVTKKEETGVPKCQYMAAIDRQLETITKLQDRLSKEEKKLFLLLRLDKNEETKGDES